MVGSATFTMVASSVIIRAAPAISSRTSPGWSIRRFGDAAGMVDSGLAKLRDEAIWGCFSRRRNGMGVRTAGVDTSRHIAVNRCRKWVETCHESSQSAGIDHQISANSLVRSEPGQQGAALGRAEAGAGVPARAGLVGAVRAAGDVAQPGAACPARDAGVQLWLRAGRACAPGPAPAGRRARPTAGRPRSSRRSPGPGRRRRPGSRCAGRRRRRRRARPRPVFDVPRRHRHTGARLPGRQRERVADAAAGGAAARPVVPDRLALDGAGAGELQRRPAAGEHVRAGGREVDVRRRQPLPVPSSLEPLSPAATVTVTPIAAASAKAWSIAVRACAVHWSSLCPQLMLIAVGVGVACVAVGDRVEEAGVGVGREVDDDVRLRARSRRRPRCRAAPRRRRRSGSWPGSFLAPSTLAAVTFGRGQLEPFEVGGSGRPAPKPPPSSMMASVCPVPSVPAGIA